jgi:hypothetical protein
VAKYHAMKAILNVDSGWRQIVIHTLSYCMDMVPFVREHCQGVFKGKGRERVCLKTYIYTIWDWVTTLEYPW